LPQHQSYPEAMLSITTVAIVLNICIGTHSS